jgi:hypothetical protein
MGIKSLVEKYNSINLVTRIFIGIIVGLYYEPFYLLKQFFKNKVVGHVINVIWLTSSVLFYVIFSTIYHFENILFIAVDKPLLFLCTIPLQIW